MDSIAEMLFVDDDGEMHDENETPPAIDDRKERMNRYALRDESLDEILAAYLADQLIRNPAFLRDFERALTETRGNVLRNLLFIESSEWRTRRALDDKQTKHLKLPWQDIFCLEEALEQLFPKLRRAKVPSVAKAHALALKRATTGRLTSGT